MITTIQNKIQALSDAARQVASWRQANQKIIWTNGVFDLLHLGHLKYLAAARDLGDKLIVGINSDASVQRIKGINRPIHGEDFRLWQIAALLMTDLVILFEQDTPIECIKILQPDLIVKGGDYTISEVVGGKEALKWGGKVTIIPFEQGHSSSNLIRKIKSISE